MPFDTHVAVKTLTAAAAELARGTAGADEAFAEAVVGVARDAGADHGHEVATRTDMAALKTDIATLRTEMAALEVRLLKWMIGTAVAVAGVAVAVLRLLE